MQRHKRVMSTDQWLQVDATNPDSGWLSIGALLRIIRYLTPQDRLLILARINKAFHTIVYSPQCFRDLWIVPIIPSDATTQPAFISVAHRHGRWCILVNFALRHTFIIQVVSHLDRWYLPSTEFSKRSKQNLTNVQDPFLWINAKCHVLEVDLHCDYNTSYQTYEHRHIDIQSLPNSHNINHLFLNGANSIEYNIVFPPNMETLHLHGFDVLFRSKLWQKQMFTEARFILVEYLSLYECHFDMEQIQAFSKCPVLSIVELMKVSWKGIFYLPPTLKSVRWKAIRGKLSFKHCEESTLIECIVPTLSKSILNTLRKFWRMKRLVLFCKNAYTLTANESYHLSESWEKQKALKVVYNKVLERTDKNLKMNLKVIFPHAVLQSANVIQKNDYAIWETDHERKYVQMLKAVQNDYTVLQ
eukprot:104112_1